MKLFRLFFSIGILILLCLMGVFGPAVSHAQETATPQPMSITGTITAVNGNTITVSGLQIDVSNIPRGVVLEIGSTVQVEGVVQGGVVIAQTVVVVTAGSTPTPAAGTPVPAGTATTAATSAPPSGDDTTIVVIIGPVQAIQVNIITIFDINIQVEADHPILTLIQVGQVIRVHGYFSGDIFIATVVSNIIDIDPDGAEVVVEGPIQSITGSVVVINSISIQLNPADPLLADLRVGHVLRVKGKFKRAGTIFILEVVVFVMIQGNTGGGGSGGGGDDDDDD